MDQCQQKIMEIMLGKDLIHRISVKDITEAAVYLGSCANSNIDVYTVVSLVMG